MTMKKIVHLTLILLFVFILGACATATPQPVETSSQRIEGMINPGDKIGDFLITTGDGEDIIFVSKLHCPFDSGSQTESCEEPVGTKVNVVGIGFYDDDPSSGKTLDEYWSEGTHEMSIEGRPVNVQAFGSVDFNSVIGTVRVWDVVIVSDKPGKITIHSTGIAGGDPFDYTVILTFTEP
jgi:hypothetical protein